MTPGKGWLRSALRLAGPLFVVFVAVNAFFLWSADAWFYFLRPPTGLVNPIVDKWVILPLALAIWAPQALSYGIFNYIEKLGRFDAVETVVIVSLLSTATYTPAILWVQARRRRKSAAAPTSENEGHRPQPTERMTG